MGKIAFLFAGQGAQYPGMGQSLCQTSPAAAAWFDLAESLRPGTKAQCFSGTAEELAKTCNTQPCVYAVDLAAALALREAGVRPEGVAGFSLGELAALTFAGAFTQTNGFQLVCRRAERMEVAAQQNPSSMAAILKLSAQQVEELCAAHPGVYPVNYNCPGQIVVAGSADLLPAFCDAVAGQGGRAKVLAVGGGFHSPYMSQAARAFAEDLAAADMHPPILPVYADCTAELYGEDAKETLSAQIDHPVRWQAILERMAADGFTTFIEVGPGKTLSGLVRRTLPDALSLRVEDKETLEETLAALQ